MKFKNYPPETSPHGLEAATNAPPAAPPRRRPRHRVSRNTCIGSASSAFIDLQSGVRSWSARAYVRARGALLSGKRKIAYNPKIADHT